MYYVFLRLFEHIFVVSIAKLNSILSQGKAAIGKVEITSLVKMGYFTKHD